jgi:hypothetical protein
LSLFSADQACAEALKSWVQLCRDEESEIVLVLSSWAGKEQHFLTATQNATTNKNHYIKRF